ncbi:MAG: AtpZ/AtpI family protein [Candidatus Zixiibacteriota bacterium]
MVEQKKENKYSSYKQIAIFTTLPIILAVGPILGYFLGNYLDSKLNTSTYLTILFFIFGCVASGRQVYKMIVRASKEMEKK